MRSSRCWSRLQYKSNLSCVSLELNSFYLLEVWLEDSLVLPLLHKTHDSFSELEVTITKSLSIRTGLILIHRRLPFGGLLHFQQKEFVKFQFSKTRAVNKGTSCEHSQHERKCQFGNARKRRIKYHLIYRLSHTFLCTSCLLINHAACSLHSSLLYPSLTWGFHRFWSSPAQFFSQCIKRYV